MQREGIDFLKRRKQLKCPKCKALILGEDKTFCKKCGTAIEEADSRWMTPNEEREYE